MKKDTAKKWGAAMGTVVLASSALAGVGTAVAAEGAPDVPQAAAEAAEGAQGAGAVKQAAVQGEFAYDQAVVTSTASITGMFNKAAATLCAAAPAYDQQCVAANCLHGTGNCTAFDAAVADLAGEDDAKSMIIGCACSTNVAGGGAIVNAEAEGVAIQTVLAMLS